MIRRVGAAGIRVLHDQRRADQNVIDAQERECPAAASGRRCSPSPRPALENASRRPIASRLWITADPSGAFRSPATTSGRAAPASAAASARAWASRARVIATSQLLDPFEAFAARRVEAGARRLEVRGDELERKIDRPRPCTARRRQRPLDTGVGATLDAVVQRQAAGDDELAGAGQLGQAEDRRARAPGAAAAQQTDEASCITSTSGCWRATSAASASTPPGAHLRIARL